MHAVQVEEVHNCYLVMQGYASDAASDQVECPALVTGVVFIQLVFGYPNEEALWKDPRRGLDHGFYEIEGSSWSQAIDEYNQQVARKSLPMERA